MIGDFIRKILGRGSSLPPEYLPWLEEIVPLMSDCRSNINKADINKESNEDLRILLNLFFLGIIDYYAKRKSLTHGQHRYLFIESGSRIGLNPDALSVAHDSRNQLQMLAPDLAPRGADALDAGFRVGREYFEAGDSRGKFLLSIKLKQWADPSYVPS